VATGVQELRRRLDKKMENVRREIARTTRPPAEPKKLGQTDSAQSRIPGADGRNRTGDLLITNSSAELEA
jgi:hypothetical protein